MLFSLFQKQKIKMHHFSFALSLLLTVVPSSVATVSGDLVSNYIPTASFGGRCGRFRGCEAGFECVEGLNKCLPLDCIGEAIRKAEPTLNALASIGIMNDISAQVFNVSGSNSTEASVAEMTNAMMQIEADLAQCPGMVESMQAEGITPFIGAGFEVQLIAQLHALVALSPRGLLRGKCVGRGFGAEIGATAVFGALFTDNVTGTWDLVEIADVIPTVLEIPYIFTREEDSAFGVAFGVGTTIGFDAFSTSTCEFTLNSI